MEKYTLGVDYGSLSARAVICRVRDGAVMAQHEMIYPHGVMMDALPDGTPLPAGFFLQHPADYLLALEESVRGAMAAAGIPKEEIIGMAVDFTGCTPLPLDQNGTPLCFREEFKSHPFAYVNMWKQRNAYREAQEIEESLLQNEPKLLKCYGGHVSPDMLPCKALKMLREDPAVFAATDRFVEAQEYMLQVLTGQVVRNASLAAAKSFWRADSGYPACFAAVHAILDHPENTFLRGRVVQPGENVGGLTAQMAEKLGLCAGMPVAGGHFDAHAAAFALNMRGEGEVLITLGTSSGLIYGAKDFREVEGVSGAVYGMILPRHYSYASGQPAFGDTLNWYVHNALPAQVQEAAEKENISVHAYLTREAEKLRPGQSGMVALDWWNGSRSCLMDGKLSGMLLGMGLTTTAAEIYRTLMEGISFGLRRMVDSYREKGFPMHLLCACGGMSLKNPLLMQIISDVTALPVRCSKNVPAPAVGACMLAAVAAGAYEDIYEAMTHMHCLDEGMYHPIAENVAIYEKIYREYLLLHDHFGRGVNPVMHTLRDLSMKAREKQ